MDITMNDVVLIKGYVPPKYKLGTNKVDYKIVVIYKNSKLSIGIDTEPKEEEYFNSKDDYYLCKIIDETNYLSYAEAMKFILEKKIVDKHQALDDIERIEINYEYISKVITDFKDKYNLPKKNKMNNLS